MCNCIDEINGLLFKQGANTIIGDSTTLDMQTGKVRTVVEISVYKRDPKKREKARGMIPAYCPFCGKKYEG